MHFIADQHGPVWTDTGQLGLVATATWDELPNPQIILIPGGSGTMKAAQNQALLNWLKGAHERSEWTTSVCTGAFVPVSYTHLHRQVSSGYAIPPKHSMCCWSSLG